MEVGDHRSLMEEEGLMEIAVILDLEVVVGEEGVLIGGKILGIGFAGGRVLLFSVSEGIALACCGGVAFLSSSLGLLFVGRGALQGGVAAFLF